MSLADFGIGDIGSGLIGGIFGALGQSQTNQMNAQNAWQNFLYQSAMQHDQQAYNTAMANTQYQRTVTDMKAAGLNPILAAGGFSPNSASSGQGSAGSIPEMSSPMSAAVSSGGQLAKLIKELGKLDADIKKTGAETSLTEAKTKTEGEMPENVQADTHGKREIPANARSQRGLQSAQTIKTVSEAEQAHESLQDYKRGGSGQISLSVPKLGNVSVPVSVLQRFGIDGTRKILGLSGAENAAPTEPPSSARALEDRAKALGSPNFQRRRSDGGKHENRAN